MNSMGTVSSAVLLAALVAMSGSTAFAATAMADAAKVTMGTKTDLLAADTLASMVGSWTNGDLVFLDKAASIKVYDTKSLYPAAEQAQIASAETAKSAQLGKFRDAIRADGGLSGWFTSNKIDVNRVTAVADPRGNPEIFLF